MVANLAEGRDVLLLTDSDARTVARAAVAAGLGVEVKPCPDEGPCAHLVRRAGMSAPPTLGLRARLNLARALSRAAVLLGRAADRLHAATARAVDARDRERLGHDR